MKYVSMSEARDDLPALLDSPERVILTRNGKPVAVLVSLEEFRVMRATQALAGVPDELARILESHRRVQGGDLSTVVELSGDEGDDQDPPARIARRDIARSARRLAREVRDAARRELERTGRYELPGMAKLVVREDAPADPPAGADTDAPGERRRAPKRSGSRPGKPRRLAADAEG